MTLGSLLRPVVRFSYQLFVIVFFFLWTVSWDVWCCVAGARDGSGDRAHRCLISWAKIGLALAGLRVDVLGLERLDPRETYIFMANHASFLDILLAFAYIPYNFRIITKEEMFCIPFMGWALKKSRQIPMDRANPRKGLRSLRQASDLLKKGISIVVFPEGSRAFDGKIQDFKTTLFILPIRSEIPVAPVLIEGTFEALKRGSILLNRVPLRITFLDPIPPGSFKDQDRALYAKRVHDVLAVSPAPKPSASSFR